MSANEDRKYTQIIDYVVNQVGTDVDRDLLRVALEAQDVDLLVQDIEQIGGVDQSGADLLAALYSVTDDDELRTRLHGLDDSNTLQEIQGEALDTAVSTGNVALLTYLARALNSQGQDELVSRIAGTDGVQVAEEQLDTAAGATDVALLTYLARALNSQGQDELVARLVDAGGTQIDPDRAPEYPNAAQQQDLIGTGDLTVNASVRRSEQVVIAANSTDGNSWSASVVWEDGSGNQVMQESAQAIGLDTVTEASARVIRKGAVAVVTFTDGSGASQNNINAYVDAHR